MIKIVVRDTRRAVGELERELVRIADLVASDLLDVARKNTPIDKGQARQGWRKEKSYRQTSVINRVPYAQYLEEGHSKQAPNGILGPTVREISRRRYK